MMRHQIGSEAMPTKQFRDLMTSSAILPDPNAASRPLAAVTMSMTMMLRIL
jgi:hypothetical protein